MKKNPHRLLTRAALLPLVAGTVLLGAAPASAHVTVTPSSTAAGSSSVLSFSVGHGCDGSPTKQIAIQVPEDILSVTPTRNPFWESRTVMEKLDEPVTDAHGNQVTERVDQVVYTAKTPLPDGQRDTFELSLSLPEAEGETLAFPTIQRCVQGQTAWTEVAGEGQDSHDLESPAPLVTITAPEEEAHAHGSAETAGDPSGGTEASETPAPDEDDGNGLAIAGLVAGLLGLVAGGAALVAARRKG